MDLHKFGYWFHDFHAANVVKDLDGSIKLIDLEDVQPHRCSLKKEGSGSLRRMMQSKQCVVILKAAAKLSVQL